MSSTYCFTSLVGAMLAALSLSLSQCSQPSGALTASAVHDALDARSLYLTDEGTTWLHDDAVRIPVSAADKARISSCIKAGQVKLIPDDFYEGEDDPGDDDVRVFYLLSSNGQTLVARADDEEVQLDDISLSTEAGEQLYTILMPYINQLMAASPASE